MSPLLQLAEDVRGVKFERRDIATREEANFYLKKWAQRGYASSHPIAILAFHGHSGNIELGRGSMDLEEIGGILEGKCDGRYIHFDSCKVFNVSVKRIREFRQQTGARVVSGYRKDIDWIESAAFSLHILDALADGEPILDSLRKMHRRNGELAQRLGFRAVGARGELGFSRS